VVFLSPPLRLRPPRGGWRTPHPPPPTPPRGGWRPPHPPPPTPPRGGLATTPSAFDNPLPPPALRLSRSPPPLPQLGAQPKEHRQCPHTPWFLFKLGGHSREDIGSAQEQVQDQDQKQNQTQPAQARAIRAIRQPATPERDRQAASQPSHPIPAQAVFLKRGQWQTTLLPSAKTFLKRGYLFA